MLVISSALRECILSIARLNNDSSSDAKSTVERGEFTYIFASPEILQEKRWWMTSIFQANIKQSKLCDSLRSGKQPFHMIIVPSTGVAAWSVWLAPEGDKWE